MVSEMRFFSSLMLTVVAECKRGVSHPTEEEEEEEEEEVKVR
jgi:hypothetical protein